MSKELKSITESVMDQIRDEKIKMKPRAYFVIGSLLTFIGLVSSIILSIFSFGLIKFLLRSHGAMGGYRLDQIISNFPWWSIPIAILGLILGIYLLRKYDFSFKINFKVVILVFLLAIIAGAFMVDSIGLNDALFRRGPMRGMMKQYIER